MAGLSFGGRTDELAAGLAVGSEGRGGSRWAAGLWLKLPGGGGAEMGGLQEARVLERTELVMSTFA